MAKRPTRKPQDRDWHVPLEETLKWIEKGEKLFSKWAALPGKAAERMAESHLKQLESLRKQADKLWKLHQEEQAALKAKKKK